MQNKKLLLAAVFLLLNLTGCATISPVAPPKIEGIPGIYHRVERGQTLWRISKIYNTGLEELVKINRISDAASIEVGQLIFIPHGQIPKITSGQYSTEDFIWPVKGKVIANFGQVFQDMLNKGINIQPYRAADVLAARSGQVVFCSPDFEGFRNLIIIDHGDGFSSVYARNSQVLIKTGDSVKKGSVIAQAGSANRDKDAYLHFEIRKGHIPQNPYFYLPRYKN
ncbi:MAG: LysM peptidoglycan-binding domain-containing M23 family metallopeptidase [Candidatus Omnitrophica bacterium]|nr:LysM peptidoglycan-binding domain-containing M23 family metallopeptidase [Candidatus Omnitrophota bacterium]